MGTLKLFMPHNVFVRRGDAEQHEMQDCFYGLTAMCSELTRKHQWLQSVCGTSMEMVMRVNLPDTSPVQARTASMFHSSHIRVDDMLALLQNFLDLDADTAAQLRPHLEQLQGRPIFFFDDFLGFMWWRLNDKRVTSWMLPACAGCSWRRQATRWLDPQIAWSVSSQARGLPRLVACRDTTRHPRAGCAWSCMPHFA